jgi:riboflavin kinase
MGGTDDIANLPDSSLDPLNELGLTGIFFGFARIHPSDDTPHPTALPTASPSPTPTPSEQNDHAPRPTTLIRHLSDLHASGSLPVPGQEKKLDLDAEAISAIPAHTAPYPSNSCAGMDGNEKRRLGKEDGKVWPMVMSVGYNPYFKNEKLTAVSLCFFEFEPRRLI